MNDALGSGGRALAGVFEPFGYTFIEIDLSRSDAFQFLDETIKSHPIECVMSHVGMAADVTAQTSDGREVNYWAANHLPFISFYGDSPAYFFDRHVMAGPGFACFYAFPEHSAFRKALPNRKGLIGNTPLRLMDDTLASRIDFRAKVGGKLLFLKNGNDPEQLVQVWRNALPLNVFLLLTELSGHLVSQIATTTSVDLDRVVCAYFRDRGLDVDAMVSLRLFFVAQLDDYLRRVKSTSIAEVLKKFPVEIHGYNWEHVDFSGGSAKYVAGGDYTASRQRIQGSLGLIDMSPNTEIHPHDRVLRAFGLHTLCLTNEQAFFKQHFERWKDFTFRFDNESLEDRLADVLSHPGRFVELGMENAATFRRKFDSEAFARTIVDVAACLRLATGARPPGMQEFFAWPPAKLD